MRISIVSEFVPGFEVALERSYVRAFEQLGHSVTPIPFRFDPTSGPRSLRQLNELRLVITHQAELTREVRDTAPDFVLIVKGRGVLADSVRAWRRDGVRVFNLFPDSPFEGMANGLVSRTLMAQFRMVEKLFVHDRFAVGHLRQLGVPAEYIAFARDPFIQNVDAIEPSVPAEPIVFIGNPDAERVRFLRAVADLGLGLYGGWHQARLSPNDPLARCVRGGVQLGADLVRTVRSAQLSINVLRTCQKTAHNMRTFETPATGVCGLSEASVGVQEHFAAGEEVFVFRSPEDLRHTAIDLLARPSAIDDVAAAGHARVQNETYVARAGELLAML